jgi:hypothetical protein
MPRRLVPRRTKTPAASSIERVARPRRANESLELGAQTTPAERSPRHRPRRKRPPCAVKLGFAKLVAPAGLSPRDGPTRTLHKRLPVVVHRSKPQRRPRCAVCGVRCAVCGVRCAVCGVRCAAPSHTTHNSKPVMKLQAFSRQFSQNLPRIASSPATATWEQREPLAAQCIREDAVCDRMAVRVQSQEWRAASCGPGGESSGCAPAFLSLARFDKCRTGYLPVHPCLPPADGNRTAGVDWGRRRRIRCCCHAACLRALVRRSRRRVSFIPRCMRPCERARARRSG